MSTLFDDHAPGDLVGLTMRLIDVPSVSYKEQQLADLVEASLRSVPWLSVERVGDNVVARTSLGRTSRLVLAGHLDTVPGQGNEVAVLDGEVISGLGACDMKGTLAVMLDVARSATEPATDVTYVFYAREEVRAADSGLGELFTLRPDLVAGDAAILGEPSAGGVEAGCQGTLRAKLSLRGVRAHTARAWMGRNAVHRLGSVLQSLESHEPDRPVLGGLTFHEAMQAVQIEGGVAGNVVPDAASVLINVRFAPHRSGVEALDLLRGVIGGALEDGDTLELVDCAEGAPPSLDHPLLAPLRDELNLAVEAKLGWTDVARFAEHGIPAANVGAGNARFAHAAGEHVTASELRAVRSTFCSLIGERG